MKPRIVNPEKNLTPGDLHAFEAAIGCPLPAHYREFLLQSNGGRPKPPGFSFARHGRKENAMVGDFYSIYEGREANLARKQAVFRGRIPPGFLAVGDDPGGNQILLGLLGEHHGQVYYWVHDTDDEVEVETDPRNLGFVADNFDEFLESLDQVRA